MSRNLSARIERLEQQAQGFGARAVFLQTGDKAKPLTGYAVGKPVRGLESSEGAQIVKRGLKESEDALLQRALEAARSAMPLDEILKLSELRGPLLEAELRGWTGWRL